MTVRRFTIEQDNPGKLVQLSGPRSAPQLVAVIGPRGFRGEGVLGIHPLADLQALYPAAGNDGAVAVASDIGGGVVVWAVDGEWTSHAPDFAAQADALAAEAEARTTSDILAANRLDAAELAIGADPGDLTLLFENYLV